MASWLSRTNLLRTVVTQARLAARLVREPRVPLLTKGVLLIGALYVLDPLDLIPDVLPIIGELDDLTVVVITLMVFLKLCPSSATRFHGTAIAQGRRYTPMAPADDVIDAEFRRE